MIRDAWVVGEPSVKTFEFEGQKFSFMKEPDYSDRIAARIIGTTLRDIARLVSRVRESYSDGEVHIFFENGNDQWKLIACFDDSGARDRFLFDVRVEMGSREHA